jgi:hypothetical protein
MIQPNGKQKHAGNGTANGSAVQLELSGVHAPRSYEPLSSVWQGTDTDLLEAMLNFYPSIKPHPILDATFNTGRMWKGSKRSIVSMDIDPEYEPDIVGDNRVMADVSSCKIGVERTL